jgi:hypothetical protein
MHCMPRGMKRRVAKGWVLERLEELTSIFAIDICAYAVMSNHYHLVVHVAAKRARKWTLHEVVERWASCSRFHRSYGDGGGRRARLTRCHSIRTIVASLRASSRCINSKPICDGEASAPPGTTAVPNRTVECGATTSGGLIAINFGVDGV